MHSTKATNDPWTPIPAPTDRENVEVKLGSPEFIEKLEKKLANVVGRSRNLTSKDMIKSLVSANEAQMTGMLADGSSPYICNHDYESSSEQNEGHLSALHRRINPEQPITDEEIKVLVENDELARQLSLLLDNERLRQQLAEAVGLTTEDPEDGASFQELAESRQEIHIPTISSPAAHGTDQYKPDTEQETNTESSSQQFSTNFESSSPAFPPNTESSSQQFSTNFESGSPAFPPNTESSSLQFSTNFESSSPQLPITGETSSQQFSTNFESSSPQPLSNIESSSLQFLTNTESSAPHLPPNTESS